MGQTLKRYIKMSHSFVEQIVHIMWSTDNQQFHLSQPIQNELYAYITTLINSKSGKVFACGGNTDHIHLLTLLPADISLASFVGFIKAYSSKWIKHRDPDSANSNFKWQTGYCAVSVQRDRLDSVCEYIKKDESRHFSKKISYRNELSDILKQQNIPYQEQYLMESSFSKMNLHVVWSTYNRNPDLNKDIRPVLYEQISKMVEENQSKVLAIGGIDDHVHLLMEISKNLALSDLMRNVKTHATHWLKNRDVKFKNFEWQTGFGAFSVCLSGLDGVKDYIANQEEHHKQKSYADEWNEFLFRLGGPLVWASGPTPGDRIISPLRG
jgi:putative transposase